MKSNITNQDLYTAIHDLRIEIMQRVDRIEDKVADNTNWRNQLTGKITILFIVVGIGINFVMDWIQERFFNRL